MKNLREKWRSMDCRQMLNVVNGTFYGGLGLLLVAWIVSQCSQSTVPGGFAVLLCVLGMAGVFGGILLAYLRLRCPHCGASLMLGEGSPPVFPTSALSAESPYRGAFFFPF